MTNKMRTNLTYAFEDYLKGIYELTLGQEPATTNQIAAHMGVARIRRARDVRRPRP